jgi:hypothetical protein
VVSLPAGAGAAPAGLRVQGGPGGTRARLDDLLAAAALLARTGQAVQRQAGVVLAIRTGPLAATLAASPATGLAAGSALIGSVWGPYGLLPAGARLVALGVAERRAAQLYLAADQAGSTGARALATGLLGPFADPVIGAGLLSFVLPRLVPGSDPVGRVGVSPTGGWRPVRPATGATGLAAAIAELERGAPGPAGAGPQIRVERLVAAGRIRWLVSVAGTRDWSVRPGADPFDLTSNLALVAGRPADSTAAVLAAMTAAGIRPGEPVLIAGHSQGGMVAAAVAADAGVRRRFSVTHLVTLGAPISRVPVPAEVAVLALENGGDPVPWLDGRADPDRRSWVTVSSPAQPVPPSTAAHAAGRYLQTAEQVDTSADPSLQAWRESAAGFLSPGPTATAQTRTFTARRSPDG